MAKNLMVQGTSSGAGKSIVATALCRILTQDGYSVAPFKSQNMALNSFVTDKGLEMGRAQVVQAEACNKIPRVEMNPLLLKPAGNNISQIIYMGRIYDNLESSEFKKIKPDLIPGIKDAYDTLASENDIVIIEGAGSPAEINMNENDIANMGMADLADSPVILVADIDRGGVFASIYGTIMLLKEEHRERIKGIIINKFRGRAELLEDGILKIEQLTGKPVLGIIPYINIELEDEDSITEKQHKMKSDKSSIHIEIVRLNHISNATDFDIFRRYDDVTVRYTDLDSEFTNPDLIIIPGTKNTVEDLVSFKKSKLYNQLYELNRKKGIPIIGICGGFQMLGLNISDPLGVESDIKEISGLGLLAHDTIFESEKETVQSKAIIKSVFSEDSIFYGLEDMEICGYELHCGKTNIDHQKDIVFSETFEKLGKKHVQIDGIINSENNVMGSYLHGIFDNTKFTETILNNLRNKKGIPEPSSSNFDLQEFKKNEYDKLEEHFRKYLNLNRIYEIIQL